MNEHLWSPSLYPRSVWMIDITGISGTNLLNKIYFVAWLMNFLITVDNLIVMHD